MIKSKKIILAWVALSVLTVSQVAIAVPGNITIRLNCPHISIHEIDRVTHFGSVLTGPGIEKAGSTGPTYAVFTGINPGGVPIDLIAGGYSNSGTSYDPNSGIETCSYTSSNPRNNYFDLVHPLKNGFNGIVTKSGSEEIRIKLTMG